MDKAPRDFSGFKNLAANLEMAALAGVDPFTALSRQARSVKLEDSTEAGGMPVDVVAVDVSDEFRTGEVRFYIGKDDRLLRRFTYDSKPIVKPSPPKTETPPDPNELPLDPPPVPKPLHFEYESKVAVNKEVGKVFEEQQKKLQDDLQKKADELRKKMEGQGGQLPQPPR